MPMGDGLVVWYLALKLGGLIFVAEEPFNSEEACYMAGRQAGLITGYSCVNVPTIPQATIQPTS